MERNSINEFEQNNNEQFLINTSRKQSDNPENENLIIGSNKSKEKILKLKKGRDVWIKICTIFQMLQKQVYILNLQEMRMPLD